MFAFPSFEKLTYYVTFYFPFTITYLDFSHRILLLPLNRLKEQISSSTLRTTDVWWKSKKMNSGGEKHFFGGEFSLSRFSRLVQPSSPPTERETPARRQTKNTPFFAIEILGRMAIATCKKYTKLREWWKEKFV